MTKAEFIETYGVYKTLGALRRSDFNRFCDDWSVLYKHTHIRIEYDRYNHKWIVSSDEIRYSKPLYGSLEDVKKTIRYDVSVKL